MNTCSSCVYFHRPAFCYERSGHESIMGECLSELVRNDNTDSYLNRPLVPDDGEPLNGAVASCDEARALLLVGPDFGCIHHKEKS